MAREKLQHAATFPLAFKKSLGSLVEVKGILENEDYGFELQNAESDTINK